MMGVCFEEFSISGFIKLLQLIVLFSELGLGTGDKVNMTLQEFNDLEHSYPTNCQVCRFLVEEIYIYMDTSSNHDVLKLGSEFQNRVRKVPYNKSELRLVEALENSCQKMLEYKVHKDRPIRYARGESTTFTTLRGLRDRGVKVELGFPEEMWDSPDREVQVMKMKCEKLVEENEEFIEEWYHHHQDKNLTQWFCADHVLKNDEQDCLDISAVDAFKDGEQGQKTLSSNFDSRKQEKVGKHTTVESKPSQEMSSLKTEKETTKHRDRSKEEL